MPEARKPLGVRRSLMRMLHNNGPHTCLNTNCFYNVVKWYKTRKEQSDKNFLEVRMTQFSKKKRDKHMAKDGSLKLAQRRFFRANPQRRQCD